MRDVDLRDVPPLLRRQTRRRIRAIRDYLSPTKHKAFTAKWFAKQLGISEGHFRTLVKSWKQHQNALAVSGDRRPYSSSPPQSPQRPALQPELTQVIDQLALDAGPGTAMPEIMRKLAQRCAELGLRYPNPKNVARYLSQTRASASPNVICSELLVGPLKEYTGLPVLAIHHRALKLRVRANGEIAAPVVSIAILLPELFIVAHRVSIENPTAQSTAELLLQALALQANEAEARPIYYPVGNSQDWQQLDRHLAGCGASHLSEFPELAFLVNRISFSQPAPSAGGRDQEVESTIADLAALTAWVGKAVTAENQRSGWSEAGAIPPFALSPRQRSSALRTRITALIRQSRNAGNGEELVPTTSRSFGSSLQESASSRMPKWLIRDNF